MTEVSISATTTTTTTKAVLLRTTIRATIKTAWRLNSFGTRWWWWLDSLPVCVPAVLWRLCRRLQAAGEALEAWAELTAEKHWIDVLDVVARLR
jgi:hypothetical protein